MGIIREDIDAAMKGWKRGLSRLVDSALSGHDQEALVNMIAERISQSEASW